MKTQQARYTRGLVLCTAGIIIGTIGGLILPIPRNVAFICVVGYVLLLAFYLVESPHITQGRTWYRTWLGWGLMVAILLMLACSVVILVY